jgi:hypothetical protein
MAIGIAVLFAFAVYTAVVLVLWHESQQKTRAEFERVIAERDKEIRLQSGRILYLERELYRQPEIFSLGYAVRDSLAQKGVNLYDLTISYRWGTAWDSADDQQKVFITLPHIARNRRFAEVTLDSRLAHEKEEWERLVRELGYLILKEGKFEHMSPRQAEALERYRQSHGQLRSLPIAPNLVKDGKIDWEAPSDEIRPEDLLPE